MGFPPVERRLLVTIQGFQKERNLTRYCNEKDLITVCLGQLDMGECNARLLKRPRYSGNLRARVDDT